MNFRQQNELEYEMELQRIAREHDLDPSCLTNPIMRLAVSGFYRAYMQRKADKMHIPYLTLMNFSVAERSEIEHLENLRKELASQQGLDRWSTWLQLVKGDFPELDVSEREFSELDIIERQSVASLIQQSEGLADALGLDPATATWADLIDHLFPTSKAPE